MITVTERALEKAISLMKEEKHPDGSFIRVGVDGGGCSGLTYKLEFDHEVKDSVRQIRQKITTPNNIQINSG